MKADTMLTTDDLARLRKAIEQAEHKPGEWATSGLAMGVAVKAGTESLSAGTGAIALTVQEGQRIGAFPYKRDGWLAVEAVNALPELLRVYAAVLGAPEVWAGCGPNGWGAGSDFQDAAHVQTIMSGWGTHEERARITATRVRLVPLATAKGESNG